MKKCDLYGLGFLVLISTCLVLVSCDSQNMSTEISSLKSFEEFTGLNSFSSSSGQLDSSIFQNIEPSGEAETIEFSHINISADDEVELLQEPETGTIALNKDGGNLSVFKTSKHEGKTIEALMEINGQYVPIQVETSPTYIGEDGLGNRIIYKNKDLAVIQTNHGESLALKAEEEGGKFKVVKVEEDATSHIGCGVESHEESNHNPLKFSSRNPSRTSSGNPSAGNQSRTGMPALRIAMFTNLGLSIVDEIDFILHLSRLAYQQDIGVDLVLEHLVFANGDPFPNAVNSTDLLSQMRNLWLQDPTLRTLERNFVYYFTDRTHFEPTVAGKAYLQNAPNGICRSEGGYTVGNYGIGARNGSSVYGDSNTFSHELGHGMNSNHCGVGTNSTGPCFIMNVLGSWNSPFSGFGPYAQNMMQQTLNHALTFPTCISNTGTALSFGPTQLPIEQSFKNSVAPDPQHWMENAHVIPTGAGLRMNPIASPNQLNPSLTTQFILRDNRIEISQKLVKMTMEVQKLGTGLDDLKLRGRLYRSSTGWQDIQTTEQISSQTTSSLLGVPGQTSGGTYNLIDAFFSSQQVFNQNAGPGFENFFLRLEKVLPLGNTANSSPITIRNISITDEKVELGTFYASGNSNDFIGEVMAEVGDQDGDGLADIAVGSPDWNAGKVTIRSGINHSIISTIYGNSTGSHFGASITKVGDLDGDHIPEFLVGAPNEDKVYLYKGGQSSPINLHVFSASGTGRFGSTVLSVKDLDGDSKPDILVAAPDYVGNSGQYGYVTAFSTATLAPLWTQYGNVLGGRFGTSLATEDGQIFVGSPNVQGGSGYVAHLDSLGQETFRLRGSSSFGQAIAVLPHYYFGPRYILAVGEPMGGIIGNGTVNIYHLPPQGSMSFTPPLIRRAPVGATEFGRSMANLGDFTGDTLSDLAVGMKAAQQGNSGIVQVYSDGGLFVSRTFTGKPAMINFGNVVASAGDVNGDGYNDLLVGSPGDSISNFNGTIDILSTYSFLRDRSDKLVGNISSVGRGGYFLGNRHSTVKEETPILVANGFFEPYSENRLQLTRGFPNAQAILLVGSSVLRHVHGLETLVNATTSAPFTLDSNGNWDWRFMTHPAHWDFGVPTFVQVVIQHPNQSDVFLVSPALRLQGGQ